MKKISYFVALLLITIATAHAKNRVCILDIRLVDSRATVFSDLKRQVERHTEKFKPRITKLQEQEKELIKKKDILSEKALKKKQKEFAEAKKNFEEEVERIGKVVDQKYLTAIGKIKTKFDDIMEELASNKGCQHVFNKEAILYSNYSVDITDSAIELINDKLPSYKLNLN